MSKVGVKAEKYAKLLHRILSEQNEEGKNSAEVALQQYENSEQSYAQILARISTAWKDMHHSIEVRELAAVKLLQYVEAQKSNEVGQVVVSYERDLVELILPHLGDQNEEIREAYVNVIAVVVKRHWETLFPQVLPALITNLCSHLDTEVLGALAVIQRFYTQVSEKERFNCIKQVIPKLVDMISSNSSASECRIWAVKCIGSCVDRIGTFDDDTLNREVVNCFFYFLFLLQTVFRF